MSDIVEVMARAILKGAEIGDDKAYIGLAETLDQVTIDGQFDMLAFARAALAALEAEGWAVAKKIDYEAADEVAAAVQVGRLAELALTSPTKENLVLHAVAVWRQGCPHGAPGECPECNTLFLDILRDRLAGRKSPGISHPQEPYRGEEEGS